jgi:hypothetical protein
MVEGDNARMSGLNHADVGPRSESHFIETPNEVGVPVHVKDVAGFAGMQQMQRDDLRHGEAFQRRSRQAD